MVDQDSSEVQTPTQSRFSRWSSIVLMVAILAVAGIVSALTAMRFAIRGREVAVPSLAGKTKSDAEVALASLGLKLKVSSSRFSSTVPKARFSTDSAEARG
jgi:beta-lactam-binding protein with PASTA domain